MGKIFLYLLLTTSSCRVLGVFTVYHRGWEGYVQLWLNYLTGGVGRECVYGSWGLESLLSLGTKQFEEEDQESRNGALLHGSK